MSLSELNLPILEALPAIHVTVLGVVAAFFSAFGVYAYQKVNDAKEKLNTAVKFSRSISAPKSLVFESRNKFLTDKGTLDWDNSGKNLLREVVQLYSNLGNEYGNDYKLQRELSSEEVIMACEELHTLLSTIFRTYPFWNGSHSHAPEQIGKDNKSIDSKRIQEMQRIIGYLCFTWRTKKQSILMLAKKGIEFNLAKKEEEQRQIFECNMRSLDNENITQSFREKTWDDYHQPRIKVDTDF